MAKDYKVGDHVALRSGGPVMEITDGPNDDGELKCEWIENGQAKTFWYMPARLRMVQVRR